MFVIDFERPLILDCACSDGVREHGFAPTCRIADVVRGFLFVDVCTHFLEAVQIAKADCCFDGRGLAPIRIIADVALTVQFADFPLVFLGAACADVVHGGVFPGVVSTNKQRVLVIVLFASFRRGTVIFVVLDPLLFIAVVVLAFACHKEVVKCLVGRGIASGELIFVFHKMRKFHATESVIGTEIGFGKIVFALGIGSEYVETRGKEVCFFVHAAALKIAIDGFAVTGHLQVESEIAVSDVVGKVDQVFEIGFGRNLEPARARLVGIHALIQAAFGFAIFVIFFVTGTAGDFVVGVFGHPSVRAELNGFVGVSAFGIQDFAFDDGCDACFGFVITTYNGGIFEFFTAKVVFVIFFVGVVIFCCAAAAVAAACVHEKWKKRTRQKQCLPGCTLKNVHIASLF